MKLETLNRFMDIESRLDAIEEDLGIGQEDEVSDQECEEVLGKMLGAAVMPYAEMLSAWMDEAIENKPWAYECEFCGETFFLEGCDGDVATLMATCQAHEQECESNPLNKRIKLLQAALEKSRVQADDRLTRIITLEVENETLRKAEIQGLNRECKRYRNAMVADV